MPPVHTVKCVTGACTPAPNMATLWLHFGMCHWHLYSCTQHGHSMAALWNVSLAPVLLHPTWPLYGCTLKCVTGTCTPAPNMATLWLHFEMCHWHLYSCTQHGHSIAAQNLLHCIFQQPDILEILRVL